MAILGTCAACVLAGSWVSAGPPWVRHAPRPAVVTYLVILTALLIWGCVRGWRIGLRVDPDGVTVRNFFRTYRFSLAEVSCFTDGSALGGESQHWWALWVVLRDGRTVTARGTTRSGTPSPKTLTAIGEAAERCGIQATLTGVASKRRWRANPEPAPSPEAGGIVLGEWAASREFSTTRLRPGYNIEEVDAFLEAIRQTFLGIREPSLPVDEIRKKKFSTTRLRGYDEEEVDAFLNAVDLRLAALTQPGDMANRAQPSSLGAGGPAGSGGGATGYLGGTGAKGRCCWSSTSLPSRSSAAPRITVSSSRRRAYHLPGLNLARFVRVSSRISRFGRIKPGCPNLFR